jgi:hypothetical protein
MCSLDIAAFTKRALKVPPGATHYRFVLAAAAHDFAARRFFHGAAESAYVKTGAGSKEALMLTVHLPEMGAHPVILAVALQFFEESGGQMRIPDKGAANAMEVVKVEV